MTFQITRSVITSLPSNDAGAAEPFRQTRLALPSTGDVALSGLLPS
jgi:hypothetical protein